MPPRRWLLVLNTRQTDDEAAYAYQLTLYALDAPNAAPIVVATLDELLDALLARRADAPPEHIRTPDVLIS